MRTRDQCLEKCNKPCENYDFTTGYTIADLRREMLALHDYHLKENSEVFAQEQLRLLHKINEFGDKLAATTSNRKFVLLPH